MSLRAKIALALIVIPGVTLIALLYFISSFIQDQNPEIRRQLEENEARVNEQLAGVENRANERNVTLWLNYQARGVRDVANAPFRAQALTDLLRTEVDTGLFASAIRVDAEPLLAFSESRRAPKIENLNVMYFGEISEREAMRPLSEADLEAFDEVLRLRAPVADGQTVYAAFYPVAEGESNPSHLIKVVLNTAPVRRWESAEINLGLGKIRTISTLTLGIGTLILAAILLISLRNYVLNPLRRLTDGSRRVMNGDYSVPVPVSGGDDEIARLVHTFNDMQEDIRLYHEEMEQRIADAMERIRAHERSLQVAQRLASTGTLAAGLAHEINNPLGGMQNAVRRLKKRGDKDERTTEYLELIEEGLHRVQDLMGRILDFSRKRDEQAAAFDMNTCIKRAATLVQHRFDGDRQALDLKLDPALSECFGQESAIGQVILNLLMNARDALSEDKGKVRVSTQQEDAAVVVQVSDDGDGMDEDVQKRIFDPFYSTKEQGKGTGLGLSIVHSIVTSHDGAIAVESELGVGTTFTIELPTKAVMQQNEVG